MMKKKRTYKIPVSICAIVLFVGTILLAILMETREMAPPRKYEVDMSGEVIGIDNGPKIPVLTKEEEKKEKRKRKQTSQRKRLLNKRRQQNQRNQSLCLTFQKVRQNLL